MVRSILLMLIPTLLALGCNNGRDQKLSTYDELHIIIQRYTPYEIDLISGDTIFNIVSFYADYNILLIDTLSSIYYHRIKCRGAGEEENNPYYPPFCNLKQYDIKNVKTSEEIILTIINNPPESKWIYLASNKDTIADTRYYKIKMNF